METAKPRIHKYDNIKGIAIILIVLGHLILITNELQEFSLNSFTYSTCHYSSSFQDIFQKIGLQTLLKPVKEY